MAVGETFRQVPYSTAANECPLLDLIWLWDAPLTF